MEDRRYDLALSLIKQAGDLLRSDNVNKSEYTIKSNKQDIVTHWDKKIEIFLEQGIHEKYQNDVIIGEEFSNYRYPDNKAHVWYIDPIDGTTNFVNLGYGFAISVAYEEEGELKFGLVLDVMGRRLFAAKAGEGAKMNNKPICINSRHDIGQMVVSCPLIPQTVIEENPLKACLVSFIKECRGLRSLGSIALELCEVASGTFDASFTIMASVWDYAAAGLILREAGGILISLNEEPLFQGIVPILAVSSLENLECIEEKYF